MTPAHHGEIWYHIPVTIHGVDWVWIRSFKIGRVPNPYEIRPNVIPKPNVDLDKPSTTYSYSTAIGVGERGSKDLDGPISDPLDYFKPLAGSPIYMYICMYKS